MRDKARQSRLSLIHHVRNQYRLVAEEGCSMDTVLAPEYYAHIAAQLRREDEITIKAEDGSWRMDVEVMDTGPQWVRVAVLNRVIYGEVQSEDDSEKPQVVAPYIRVWKGIHDRHCILRTSDNVIVKKGIPDKAQAEKEAANYQPKAA